LFSQLFLSYNSRLFLNYFPLLKWLTDYPALHQSQSKDELLQSYFARGYTYKDIRSLMETKHGISLSEDQLHFEGNSSWFEAMSQIVFRRSRGCN